MKTLSLLATAALFALAACGGASTPASQAPASPAAASPEAPAATAPAAGTVVENSQAKVGDKTKCPVMGHEFTVTADSPKAEHDGKTYYFCCPGCVEKFKADPAKYIGQPKS